MHDVVPGRSHSWRGLVDLRSRLVRFRSAHMFMWDSHTPFGLASESMSHAVSGSHCGPPGVAVRHEEPAEP